MSVLGAAVAQLVEQSSMNGGVGGSVPGRRVFKQDIKTQPQNVAGCSYVILKMYGC